MTRLSEEAKLKIIARYKNLEPTPKLARDYGVSRQAIVKMLNKEGIDTSRAPVVMVCGVCGESFNRPLCYVRLGRGLHCSRECHNAWLKAKLEGRTAEFRHGQQTAKLVLSPYYKAEKGEVFHHIDGNFFNNAPENILVFKNVNDYAYYLRFGDGTITPVFDGRDVDDDANAIYKGLL